jgi:hypothetical protein
MPRLEPPIFPVPDSLINPVYILSRAHISLLGRAEGIKSEFNLFVKEN